MMGLLSAWFDVRTRGLAVGLAAAGGSVSLMVAGVAVPLLTGRSPGDGWRHAWYIFGVLVLAIGILSLIFIRDRPRDEPESIHRKVSRQASRRAWPLSVYRNPLVWLVTSLAFCSGWATGIFNTFFGVYLSQEHGIDLSTTGHLLILMGFLSIGSGILWGRVSDRLGRGQGFLLSYLILAIAFALFWLVPVIGVLVASSVLVGLTMRAAYTLCAASAGDYVPVQFSAAAFGLISLGAGLGSSISPIIAGAIADATSDLAWTFALAMLGAAAGVAASFLLHRCSENRPHPQPLS